MTTHISVRLAWHDNGWNGSICRAPKSNTYCVGQYSYQGDMIIRDRDLMWSGLTAGEGQVEPAWIVQAGPSLAANATVSNNCASFASAILAIVLNSPIRRCNSTSAASRSIAEFGQGGEQ